MRTEPCTHLGIWGYSWKHTDQEQPRLGGGDGERANVVPSLQFTGLTGTNFKTQGSANLSHMHKTLLLFLK